MDRRGFSTLDALTAALDFLSRAALVGSLLAVARGEAGVGVAGSIVASAAILARAAVVGVSMERRLIEAFADVASWVRARSIASLRDRDEAGEGATLLVEAMRFRAEYRASLVPRVVALGLQSIAIAGASVALLGLRSLAVGAVAGALVLGVAALLRARLRGVREEQWRTSGELYRDLRVLLDGALELRAQGQERDHAARVDASARRVARAEHRFWRIGALAAWLPAAAGLFALSAPARAGVTWASNMFRGGRFADAGVLGAAMFLVAVEVVRVQETTSRWRVLAAQVPALAAASSPSVAVAAREGLPRLDLGAPLVVDGFSFRHVDAARATPSAVAFTWMPGQGLALLGANGAGKTTLALSLLGIASGYLGSMRFGDHEVAASDTEDLRSRAGFVPQTPFTLPGESLAWHAALYGDEGIVDAAIDGAGLREVLLVRASRRGVEPRDLPIGELSGGERQRFLVARALASGRALVVLDEPEAALDQAARAALRRQLEEASRTRRVLVIAHDGGVIPAAFLRVEVCAR